MTQEIETPVTTAENAERTGLTRRNVLSAAAWFPPVILLTVAVPAAAASELPTCEARYEFVDPTTTTVDHWKNDVAKIEFSISEDGTGFVRVTFVKDYASLVKLNVNHVIVREWKDGVKTGETYMYAFTSPAGTCFNPGIIQVDGAQNNAHWYSHVNGGKGGFQ